MNKKKRDVLKEATMLLERASSNIDSVLDEEQDCLDNIPENMQSGTMYEKMDRAIDALQDAISSIEDAIESINVAME